MSSDRTALGCIAAILAVPLLSGGAAAWALWRYREVHPEVTAEPPPAASVTPPPAPPRAPSSPPKAKSAAAPEPRPAPSAPPASSSADVAPAAIEASAHVVFDAKVTRLEPSGVAPGGFAPGTRCTLEATLAAVGGNGLHLASGLTARCGSAGLGGGDVAPDAHVKITEQPGLEPGTYTHSLVVLDDPDVALDTPHARASLIGEGPPERTVSLVVAGESRPITTHLLAATAEARVLQAGATSSPGDDDAASGRVVSATGDVPLDAGARCRLGFHYYGTIDGADKCDVLVVCAGVTVIGRPERFSAICKRRGSHVLSAQELKPGSVDKDPALELDERKARIWNDLDGQRWSVSLALEPR